MSAKEGNTSGGNRLTHALQSALHAGFSDEATGDAQNLIQQLENTSLSRRGAMQRTAATAINEGAHLVENSFMNDGWILINDLVNFLVDNLVARRKVFKGGIVLLTLAAVLNITLQENPNLAEDAKLRYELDSVWTEVEELQHPPTHEQLLAHVYNPFKPIELTGDELDTAIIVNDEDSYGLANGKRKNSYGPNQPDSWPILAAAKLTTGIKLLGRDGEVIGYNFAEPGSTIGGMVNFEDPEGNVQLGAKTASDMAADKPGEPTPTDVMKAHLGFLFATLGAAGDDGRDTADLLLSYIKPKSKDYNAAFADFILHPSRKKLNNDTTVRLLKEVLTSYKNDKVRIVANLQIALDDYKKINEERKGKGRMVLVVSQPPALDEFKTIPYVPLGSPRGKTGSLDVEQYGTAGHLAALWTIAPFYLLEGPLLEAFERETGIQVISTPMLAKQIPEKDLAPDSHLNEIGENDRAGWFTELVKVTDGDNQLTFTEEGTPRLAA